MPVSLALIVVTHNSHRWLAAFFDSWHAMLAARGPSAGMAVRTIVADAGSSAGQFSVLPSFARDGTIVRLGNIGYGAAANAGAKAAGDATHLLICNPDLTFPGDFARTFLDSLATGVAPFGEQACIAPRLLNPDGSVQPSVGQFLTIWGTIADQFRRREHRKYLHPQPTELCAIDWPMAACLLIRREAFEAVGGFDERFFLYVEEVDLCRRLRDGGREVWFEPGATVVHHSPNAARAPRPEVQRYAARGVLRYFAKHGSWGQLALYRLLAMASGRLSVGEALASRRRIVERSTGP